MLLLSFNLLKIKLVKSLSTFGLGLIVAAGFAAKSYLVQLIVTGDFGRLLLNVSLDALLVIVAVYYFKDHSLVAPIFKSIREKFGKG